MNNQLVRQNASVALARLSPVDEKALSTLLPGERKIIQAALQPKIFERDPLSVVDELISVITSTYTRAGQKVPDDGGVTLGIYADELFEMMCEKFPRVTVAEVAEALKAGVYGEAGEYMGLNPKSFLQFIKHFLFSEERKAAQKQFESKKLLITSEMNVLTQAQKDELSKEFINDLFESHLKGELIIDLVPVHVFDILLSVKEIKIPIDQNEELLQRANSYLQRLKTNIKARAGSREVNSLAETFKNANASSSIQNIAKKFAISDYFEACRLQGRKPFIKSLQDEQKCE